MSVRNVLCFWLGVLSVCCPGFGWANETDQTQTILSDEFDALPLGMLAPVLWARAEYHYLPECGPKGPWSITSYSSSIGSQRAWKVVESDGKKALLQTYTPESDKHTHPMIVAGDPYWTNYEVSVRFTPLTTERRRGVVFRYQNDRCYYFFGVEGQQAVLKMVQHETSFRTPFEKMLAKKDFCWEPGDLIAAEINVRGNKITVRVNGSQFLEVDDSTFPNGKIGLTADALTRFDSVRVSMTSTDTKELEHRISIRSDEEKSLQAKLPAMKFWKKIDFKDFGVGRNLRLGDLNHDGQMDILVAQIEHHGPKDQYSEVSCLTAMTLEGKMLWQVGEPDPWKDHLTNDVALQIHDLDGDGKNEVIYCKNQELIVADGDSGVTRQKVPTPQAIAGPKSKLKYPRILGDSLYFADLRGNGRSDHLILKDRYTNFWALTPKLETVWHGTCQTGHYPFAHDVDGDGRHELFVGYSLFSPEGEKVWSLDSSIKDHADALAVVNLHPERPDSKPQVLCGASDEGLYIADLEGKLLRRHRFGHVQNLTIANLRDDLPGLEIVSMNYWGNQGITHLYDADGESYLEFEPCNHGSPILPLNWTGGSEEFFIVSPNVENGGIYDGYGRRVMKFPADGHPDMCFLVQDLTGDCRDEILVWNPFEFWVYTQSDILQSERLYRPKRNPTYNFSNYQATVSLPAWSNDSQE